MDLETLKHDQSEELFTNILQIKMSMQLHNHHLCYTDDACTILRSKVKVKPSECPDGLRMLHLLDVVQGPMHIC